MRAAQRKPQRQQTWTSEWNPARGMRCDGRTTNAMPGSGVDGILPSSSPCPSVAPWNEAFLLRVRILVNACVVFLDHAHHCANERLLTTLVAVKLLCVVGIIRFEAIDASRSDPQHGSIFGAA
jgi:hypothetical protein